MARWKDGSMAGLFTLCAIAFALRVPGIAAHLPDIYWHDELNFVEGAMRVGAGEVVAAAYGGYSHGTLTYYLLFGAFAVYFLVGRVLGLFHSPDDLLMSYVTDPSPLFLVARTVMLGVAVATVALTYVLARRLFGSRAAWLSAGLLAVSFHAVQIALGKEDTLFALLVLATVSVAARIIASPATLPRFAALGALAGAAMAVKYFGVFLLPFIAVTAYLSEPPRARWRDGGRKASVAIIVAILVFLTLVPGVLFDTGRFISSFRALATINSATLFSETGVAVSPWYGYLWNSLALANGAVAAALFYVASFWMVRERPRYAALLLVYPAALIGALTGMLLFGRPAEAVNFYEVSAIPLLFVVIGGFLDHVWTSGGRPARLAVAVAFIAMVGANVADDLRFQRLLRLADNRTVARQWIEQHVPPGSAILAEGAISTFVLEGPQLAETEASLDRSLTEIRRQGGGGGLWSAKLRAARLDAARPRFDVHKVRDLTDEVLRDGPPYVVARSDRGRRLVEMDGRYHRIFAVTSDAPLLFRSVPLLSSADIARLRRLPLLENNPQISPGPSIYIYRLADWEGGENGAR